MKIIRKYLGGIHANRLLMKGCVGLKLYLKIKKKGNRG